MHDYALFRISSPVSRWAHSADIHFAASSLTRTQSTPRPHSRAESASDLS